MVLWDNIFEDCSCEGFMKDISEELYNLNLRALEFRNSKEYFIGNRIINYENLLKRGRFFSCLKLFFSDFIRVFFKGKKNPKIEKLIIDKNFQIDPIIIYTSVYGDYDNVQEPLYRDPNCIYYILTDQDVAENSVWEKYDFSEFPKNVNTPFLKNRYVKMFPHIIFKNYRYSIYLDGNLQITSKISMYMKDFKSDIGIGLHRHPSNKNLFEEAKYNKYLDKISNAEYKYIIKEYHKVNMPKNFGMFECNVILRDHMNKKCSEIMAEWWNNVLHGVKRDQLYFTYVLYLLGYTFEDVFLLGNNINANPMFIRYTHN